MKLLYNKKEGRVREQRRVGDFEESTGRLHCHLNLPSLQYVSSNGSVLWLHLPDTSPKYWIWHDGICECTVPVNRNLRFLWTVMGKSQPQIIFRIRRLKLLKTPHKTTANNTINNNNNNKNNRVFFYHHSTIHISSTMHPIWTFKYFIHISTHQASSTWQELVQSVIWFKRYSI